MKSVPTGFVGPHDYYKIDVEGPSAQFYPGWLVKAIMTRIS